MSDSECQTILNSKDFVLNVGSGWPDDEVKDSHSSYEMLKGELKGATGRPPLQS
jgi:hypothetical protein